MSPQSESPTAPPSVRPCPRCGDDGLLLAGELTGETSCKSCGGHFLDGRAARDLLTGRLGIGEEVLEGLTAEFHLRGDGLSCPDCLETLSGCVLRCVALDRCERCGGVWFDAGELHRLSRGERGRAAPLASVRARVRGSSTRRIEADVTTPVERTLLRAAAMLAAGSALLASLSVFSGNEWAVLLSFMMLPLFLEDSMPAWILSALYVVLAGGGAFRFASWSLEIGQISAADAQLVQLVAGVSGLVLLVGTFWNESYLVDFERRLVLLVRQCFGWRQERPIAGLDEVIATATKRWSTESRHRGVRHHAQAVAGLGSGRLIPLSTAVAGDVERADRVARIAAEQLKVPHVEGTEDSCLQVVHRDGAARLIQAPRSWRQGLHHVALYVIFAYVLSRWYR